MDRGKLLLRSWDQGLVAQELSKYKLIPRRLSPEAVKAAQGLIVPDTTPDNKLSVGTFSGTSKALTQVFKRIEDRFHSYFDVTGIEPSIPQGTKREDAVSIYNWSPKTGPHADNYPPHLDLIPKTDEVSIFNIFDKMRLLDTGFVLLSVVPESIKDFTYSYPDQGATMADIDKRNATLRAEKKNILSEPNIGDLKTHKWFTDEVFAQQQFTGTNPVTIQTASTSWIQNFTKAATSQNLTDYVALISSVSKTSSLYVQDCGYYRSTLGVSAQAVFQADDTPKDKARYACSSVTLFHLTDSGKLHPLAIVIDYNESIDNSVTIFNTRKSPEEQTDQANDWPWRYAKSAAQSSDWLQHELTVHLTNCHLVEEATIVASKRALATNHLVYRCLQPHWLKTLSLNAAARATLVPSVIIPIVGLTGSQTYEFIQKAYQNFDWQANYVPADLERRGFPVKDILDQGNVKFHNYGYGKMALLMWQVLRNFVARFLANGGQGFDTDAKVAADLDIKRWCDEMRSDNGGQMKSWPVIQTVDQLVDCVTMCIHIASPLHTAVNYLQEYYQSFVVNRSPSLCAPPPTSLQQLKGFQEPDLMKSLPINRPQEWLLASHLVHLLNFRVAEDQNILNYAISLYHLSAPGTGSGETHIQAAAKALVDDLIELGDTKDNVGNIIPGVFSKISDALDNQELPYDVLQPVDTAVSILI
ncbi:lipoxygenase 1 [Diaporthe amygdali]|uniref:lipoxygenase 1 n=1 Tax=Phomopsis amygdali TaxID=1214568 RepID=UPI0022FE6620|nr:lipoxygenase 1 [Diaporthe amygdali]KAJ0117003.1 lipoxygenase 1 [Diaporthe amygdali]